MKATCLLAVAFALTTSAALAQTVAPGTAPGAQTGNPSNMPSAGDPSTSQQRVSSTRKDNVDNMPSDKRAARKNGKMKTSSNGSKMKTNR
ncbi:MAG: hypothetical protein EOO56_04540 [Hymenobacter sp.]|nr:MAG: hypothetical protein EOO56_04540 [Hymenobacter sp.]